MYVPASHELNGKIPNSTDSVLMGPGGWIYIDRNDSRLRTEHMHHGTHQKQVHATTAHLLTSTSCGSVAQFHKWIHDLAEVQ